MDYKVIWDDEAIEELGQAVRYIAQFNTDAARRTGQTIFQKVAQLEQFPELGRVFHGIHRQDVREFPVPPYRIIYQVNGETRVVRILKLWHGARKEPRI